MEFKDLKLIGPILQAVETLGFKTPTPIQEQAIPLVLEGRDILGCAQTGTGKTAAFAVPILQKLYNPQMRGFRPVRALILAPTRELVGQIGESITDYGRHTRLKHATIYGGVSQLPQTRALQAGVDILVATPGRLLDLMDQGFVKLDQVSILVLDEADRMLDMGFAKDMKKIIARLPAQRQTLLFSATMPQEIKQLAAAILQDPVHVEVTPVSSTVATIEQTVYHVDKADKKSLLIKILKQKTIDSALVFTRTKHGADKVVRDLERAGIRAQAIHGNKSQTARQIALKEFKSKETRVLVATDIASRGIDVHELSHVINYDLPNEPETYVHRIGRTGRAGLGGFAVSFCDRDEKAYLHSIQKLIAQKIPVAFLPAGMGLGQSPVLNRT